MTPALKAQLEGLVREHNMQFADAVEFFASRQSELVQRYATYARENCQDDGDLEFDDFAIVSVSADRGAYVLAWKWVDQGDVGLTDLEQAQAEGEPA